MSPRVALLSTSAGVGLRRARRSPGAAPDPGLQVRRLLALARLVRLERCLRRVGRACGIAPRIGKAVRPTASWSPSPSGFGSASGIFTVFAPPPAATRMYWPLASPGAALRGDPLEPVGGLLEHPPDRLGRVLVGRVDRLHGVLRPRDHDLVEAAREGARLVEERDAAIGELGEPRDRRAQVGGQPAQLALRDQQPHLVDERGRGVAGSPGSSARRAAPRARTRAPPGRTRSGSRTRAWPSAARREAAQSTRPSASSSAANEPEKTRKLVTRSCSACSLLPSPRTTRSRPRITPGEVAGLGARAPPG